MEEASTTSGVTIDEITAIHRALMAGAPNSQVAGVVRTQQNWIGGNDYNPCGAAFVSPPTAHVDRLLADLCAQIEDDGLPRWCNLRWSMPSSRPSTRSSMATDVLDER